MDLKIVVKSDSLVDRSTDTTDLVSLILSNRNITDIEAFLNPPFPELNFHYSQIKTLVENAQSILIYGDYDVDGITATAILWQTLYGQKYPVTPFVPDREIDGYGFRTESFLNFEKQKNVEFDLLITVDNGIVAQKEFTKLKILRPNLKIIVIDHHLPDDLNDLKSFVDVIFHSTVTSGAALSWFVSRSFDPNADIGLASLGVVADMMPLLGLNRSLVFHGLKYLKLNPNPGIRKLLEVAQVKADSLTAYDLGFILGPRINAVGRLSNPTDALRLLCSSNSVTAGKYAKILDEHNRNRQELQKESLEIAQKDIDLSQKVIFVWGDYNPGIIGLIAGRLTEKHYLPSIVIASDGQIGKGSCRSIPDINIIETLRKFSHLFVDLGGHPGAAGFSIKSTNISKLKKAITKEINSQLKGFTPRASVEVECQMTLSAITAKNIKALNELEPFGLGNPKPQFLFKNLKIISKKVIGSTGDHLKLKLDDPDTKFPENFPADAIAFKKGELDKTLKVGDIVDVVAQLDLNIWNGYTSPQLIVKEIITQ